MFGQFIREQREAKNLSQNQLAKKLSFKVCHSNVSLWETDKTFPAVKHIKLMAKVFGLSFEDVATEYINGRLYYERKRLIAEIAYEYSQT